MAGLQNHKATRKRWCVCYRVDSRENNAKSSIMKVYEAWINNSFNVTAIFSIVVSRTLLL